MRYPLENPPDVPAGWASMTERGSRLGLRFIAWSFLHLGRRAIGVLLVPIVGYFWLLGGPARSASRLYLERLESARGSGRKPGRLETWRHFRAFAETILDRFCFWTGRYEDFEIVVHGRELVQRHLDAGTGAILLGAHLGSFDALRVIGRDAGVRINVVMFTANARRINQTFKELDPDCDVHVIPVDPSSVRAAFEIKRCIERGEFVALLGDRIVPGGRNRIARATFLGSQAAFPRGPFLIPLLFGLPVVLCLALNTGPRRYDVFFEPLSAGERVASASRNKTLQETIERFAGRLEHYCLLAPHQWFNFYDFWADAGTHHV